jgi:hypothetical protein
VLRSELVRRTWLVGSCLLLAGIAQAAVWPDQLGPYKKVSSKPLALENRALWGEYGLNLTEQADYAAGAKRFTATAFRFADSTGAFAAFLWQRPADSKPSKFNDAAAETPDGILFVFGNYLFRLDGWKPKPVEVNPLLRRLPGLDESALPVLHLPAAGLLPNSQRYVIGPTGLDEFEKGVPPAVAAFSMGAELEVGQYDTPAGRMQLAIFSYPTPQIAIQRVQLFQSLPGAMAKRAGPLVAVVLAPKDPNAAERLLSRVRYNGIVTEAERLPSARDNVGDLLVNIFMLTGLIIAIFIAAGIVVAVLRRLGWGTSGDPMTLLHLEDHPKDSAQS